ncbi:MAG: 5'-methylthioadenosine/S-adenosylhomocysteine nucleosidase [Archangium sp.]
MREELDGVDLPGSIRVVDLRTAPERDAIPTRSCIVLSGVGKVAAASAIAFAAGASDLRCVLNFGYCAALTEKHQVGSILIPTTFAQHDFGGISPSVTWLARPGERTLQYQAMSDHRDLVFSANIKLAQIVKSSLSNVASISYGGLLLSGDKFVASTAARESIRAGISLDAIALDMEASAVAQTCSRFGIPFACVKIVSDDAADESARTYLRSIDSFRGARRAIISALLAISEGGSEWK